jgi:hypothetical protein
MARLSSRDYERMLDLAVAILDDSGTDPPWSIVIEELTDALGCCMGILAGPPVPLGQCRHADVEYVLAHPMSARRHWPMTSTTTSA